MASRKRVVTATKFHRPIHMREWIGFGSLYDARSKQPKHLNLNYHMTPERPMPSPIEAHECVECPQAIIKDQWQLLDHETRVQMLHELIQTITDPHVSEVVNYLTQELDDKSGTENRTKLSQLMSEFELPCEYPVLMERLSPIYKGAKKAEHQVRRGIVDFNEKLRAFGYRVTHVSAFRIEPLPNNPPE